MFNILNTTILGLLFGTVGTALGGYIGINLRKKSNRFLSFILEFAAGLMIAVVCFSLIPEALEISNVLIVLFGITLGVITMIICDNIVKLKYDRKKEDVKTSFLKTGIAVGVRFGSAQFPRRFSNRFRIRCINIFGFFTCYCHFTT